MLTPLGWIFLAILVVGAVWVVTIACVRAGHKYDESMHSKISDHDPDEETSDLH